MATTKKRIRRKVSTTTQASLIESPQVVRKQWSLYDTLTFQAGVLISKDRSYRMFCTPAGSRDELGFRKTNADTNLDLACMLPMPNSFTAYTISFDIIGPVHQYEKELLGASVSYRLWVGNMLQADGIVGRSNYSISCDIAVGQCFWIDLIAKRDFLLHSTIPLIATLGGTLTRSAF